MRTKTMHSAPVHFQLGIGALLTAAPLLAFAHEGHEQHGLGDPAGLMAGFMHPVGAVDHLAAMLAVGVWTALAARRGRADLVLAPLTFLALLMTGALVTQAGLLLPAAEPVIAVSLLALGLLLATQARWPLPVVLPAVGVFAFFHGGAHGAELAGPAALAGMLLGSGLLNAVGIVVGLMARHRSAWVARITGAAVSLLGTGLLLGLLR